MCPNKKKLKTCIVKQKPINTLRRQLTLEENICNIALIPLICENLLKMDGMKSNKQTKTWYKNGQKKWHKMYLKY